MTLTRTTPEPSTASAAEGTPAAARPSTEEWMAMPAAELAARVAPRGLALLMGQDGTRRHAYLRDPSSRQDWARYTQLAAAATLDLIERCFALGVRTVVIGMLWPPNFERGDAYVRAFLGPHGLPRLYDGQHTAVYERWHAKARLSGSWRQARPEVVEEMEEISRRLTGATPSGERLILWEANAGNLMEALFRAALEVGADVDAVRARLYPDGPERIDLAINQGRIRPLNRVVSPILLDRTDLYVTNNLTLDLTEAQLRSILYDHLFLRGEAPEDNMSYSDEYLRAFRAWSAANPPRVVGLGELDPGGNWVARGGEDPERSPTRARGGDGRTAPPVRMRRDRIEISDLRVRTIIGIHPEERLNAQEVLLNLTVYADTSAAARSDRIEDAVDYHAICERVIHEVESSGHQLLETLVDRIARMILEEFGVDEVRVKAEKPQALRSARSAGVEVHRTREESVP